MESYSIAKEALIKFEEYLTERKQELENKLSKEEKLNLLKALSKDPSALINILKFIKGFDIQKNKPLYEEFCNDKDNKDFLDQLNKKVDSEQDDLNSVTYFDEIIYKESTERMFLKYLKEKIEEFENKKTKPKHSTNSLQFIQTQKK